VNIRPGFFHPEQHLAEFQDVAYSNLMSTKEVVIYPEPVRLVEVSGSHKEIGRRIGEQFREVIHHSIENAYELINSTYSTLHLNWDGTVNQGKKYLPFAQERYPQYVEEISGMAEGSNTKIL